MGAAVACARVDVESLQDAYEVHISCRRPIQGEEKTVDRRRQKISLPFQEKKTQRQAVRVALIKVGGDCHNLRSQDRFDFRIGLAATPCHFRRAKTISSSDDR